MRLSRPASFVCQPWKDGQVGHGSQRMVKLGKVHRAWARLKDMYIGSGRSELLLDDHLIVLTIVVEGMPLDLLTTGGQMGGLDLEVASILRVISISSPDPKKHCNFLVLITSVGPFASI